MRPLASIFAAGLLLLGHATADAASHGHKTGQSRSSKAKKGKRGSRKHRPSAPPAMPSRLEVVALDPASGGVRVALLGPSRPPETRLFVLTDERGRRFVPASADCQPTSPLPPSSGKENGKQAAEGPETPLVRWQCSLTVAPLYRKAALTGVSMEWGDRIVSALPGQVRSRWAEAGSTVPIPPAADAPQEEAPAPSQAAPAPDPASSSSSGDHRDDGASDDDDSEME